MKLIDSNILIYAAKPQYPKLKQLLFEPDVYVSDMSRLEVLGFHNLTPDAEQFFMAVFKVVPILPVSSVIIDKGIELKQFKKMTVGDAVIAATALLEGCELVTHNVKDFKHITGLNVVDPIP